MNCRILFDKHVHGGNVRKWKLKAPFSELCPICNLPDSQTHWLRECTGPRQVTTRNLLHDSLQVYYCSLGQDRPGAKRLAQLMASHIINSGNPQLWMGNWNTQSITLLKSLNLPPNERERVGPVIRAITDIFIRSARSLWLQRAKDSPRPKHFADWGRTRLPPSQRPPRTRPLQRITPLGALHRSIRIHEGTHPYLQRISDRATSHDSNSGLCHPSSLLRNDTSCLPGRLAQKLRKPALALSPCHCASPCVKYPSDSQPPCRNVTNNVECSQSNCDNT